MWIYNKFFIIGEQTARSGRRSSFFNTSGALEIRRQSLGAAAYSEFVIFTERLE